MNHNIIGKVAALQHLSHAELKALWVELYQQPAPNHKKRDSLIPRLAWRIQELAYGGLSEAANTQLDQLIRQQTEQISQRIKMPAIGTRLMRQYQGVEHHVTVIRNGFEYQGRTYRSLSQVARDITGTRWSGPAFFGLKEKSQ